MNKNQRAHILKVFTNAGNDPLVHMNTEQANAFIDDIVNESEVLSNIRTVRMSTPERKFGMIDGFKNPLFRKAFGSGISTDKYSQVSTEQVTLRTELFQGVFTLNDEELEDNIEGDALTAHLMRMMADEVRNQLEDAILYGQVLPSTDGWDTPQTLLKGIITRMEEDGNVVDASNSALFSDGNLDREKFRAAFRTIPTKFRRDINAIYMHANTIESYRDEYLDSRRTPTDNYAWITFTPANIIRTDRPRLAPSAAMTTISANAAAGDTTITLTSATGFSQGDTITLALGQGKEFTTEIESIASNVLTLTDALPFAYTAATATENTVAETIANWTDVLITQNDNNLWGVQRDITIETERSARDGVTYFVLTLRAGTLMLNPERGALIKNVIVN